MASTEGESIFYSKVVRVCPVKISYTYSVKAWLSTLCFYNSDNLWAGYH